eukprot:jgi/Chlat1/8293/Chrsp78S07711
MTISVGDKLPTATFSYIPEGMKVETITTEDVFKGKKASQHVVLLGVPGAFTPVCSTKHLPGFIDNLDSLKAKGVDTVACMGVNDAYVMKAWGDSLGATGKVLLLGDGSANFTKQIGVDLDLSEKGMGTRSKRFSMLVDDMEVKILNLEKGGDFEVSSADDILKAL